MKTYIRRFGALFLSFISIFLFCTSIAHASPTILSRNLSVGSRGMQVSTLQQFLINSSVLNIEKPTGYFGPLTAGAVRTWQGSHGIPSTGNAGPITRLSIAVVSTVSSNAVSSSEESEALADIPVVATSSSTPSTDSDLDQSAPVQQVAVSSHGNPPPTVNDIHYPSVISTNPGGGAAGVVFDRGVEITFSDSMDSTTITNGTFTVASNNVAVPGAVSYIPSQNTAVFYPYADLLANTTYTVTLSTGIKNTSGVGLQTPYAFNFQTSSSGSSNSFINLGVASTFGLIASTLSNTEPTTISGDVAAASAPSGVPGSISGASHVGDSTATAAMDAASAAAASADSYACNSLTSGVTDIGGQTFTPGVYCFNGPVTITGTTTLSGVGQYLFKFESSLTTAASSSISVVNGAEPAKTFWDVHGTTTLGASSNMLGTILADNSVSVNPNNTTAGIVAALNSSLAIVSSTISAPKAVYCSPILKDNATGHFLGFDSLYHATAAYVATSNTIVTGEVNASGCDFGVYVYPGSTNVNVANANIHDANQVGVFNDEANVNVSTSTIYNIGDHAETSTGFNGPYSLGGTQTGFSVYFGRTGVASGNINGNTIYNYQKEGIILRNSANAYVTGNTVTGSGSTTITAQIGVQVGGGDFGYTLSSTTVSHFTGNTVTNNIYTGGPTSAPGFVVYVLLGESTTTIANTLLSNNTVTNNDTEESPSANVFTYYQ